MFGGRGDRGVITGSQKSDSVFLTSEVITEYTTSFSPSGTGYVPVTIPVLTSTAVVETTIRLTPTAIADPSNGQVLSSRLSPD